MQALQAGPYPLPDVSMPTWLVRFDKEGVCASPGTATALIEHVRTGGYSNVLFYSHGWNTDFAAAVEQYSRYLQAFERVVQEHPLPGFKPIFVGVTWPSVWLPSTPGPQMAGRASNSQDNLVASQIEKVVAEIAEGLDAGGRAELYSLIDVPILGREDAKRLAKLVSPIIASTPAEVDGGDGETIDVNGILKLATSLQFGEQAAPLDDDLDAIGVVASGRGGVAAAGESWDPTDIIKLASLYQMKDRAARVGSTGVATLLRNLLAIPDVSINVFGHSFGAKVVLSAVCAPPALPRIVDSLLLLQPAISHLCFAETVPGRPGPGGYRSALDLVASPIFSTFSGMDFPLHKIFHLALRRPADLGELRTAGAGEPPDRYAALGGYGPRRAGERTAIDPMPVPGEAYPDLAGVKIVGLDGSEQQITSHGDVANAYTAWALRTQIERTGT